MQCIAFDAFRSLFLDYWCEAWKHSWKARVLPQKLPSCTLEVMQDFLGQIVQWLVCAYYVVSTLLEEILWAQISQAIAAIGSLSTHHPGLQRRLGDAGAATSRVVSSAFADFRQILPLALLGSAWQILASPIR